MIVGVGNYAEGRGVRFKDTTFQ